MRSINQQRVGNSNERLPYEVPAIIYEGLISTRAGTSLPGSSTNSSASKAADPADIFGGSD